MAMVQNLKNTLPCLKSMTTYISLKLYTFFVQNRPPAHPHLPAVARSRVGITASFPGTAMQIFAPLASHKKCLGWPHSSLSSLIPWLSMVKYGWVGCSWWIYLKSIVIICHYGFIIKQLHETGGAPPCIRRWDMMESTIPMYGMGQSLLLSGNASGYLLHSHGKIHHAINRYSKR